MTKPLRHLPRRLVCSCQLLLPLVICLFAVCNADAQSGSTGVMPGTIFDTGSGGGVVGNLSDAGGFVQTSGQSCQGHSFHGGNFGASNGFFGRGSGGIAGNNPRSGKLFGQGLNGARPNGLFGSDWSRTVTVFGGWNQVVDFFQETSGTEVFDDDFAVGLAIGRRHNSMLRSEFEFTYRSNDEIESPTGPAPILEDSVNVYSVMKNFFFDFGNEYSTVRPYVGIGIGYSYIDTDFTSTSGLDIDEYSAFSWQPIAGVAFRMNQVTHAFFEYRYFATTDLDIFENGVLSTTRESSYDAHNLFVGLRFEF